jgi:hemerythrin superfamily protein
MPAWADDGMLTGTCDRIDRIVLQQDTREEADMPDVVDLIKAQHRQIEKLLEQAQEAEPEQMAELVRQVGALLLPHSQAEESFVYPAIRDHARDEQSEVKDGVAEHHHIEDLLRELLDEAPDTPGYDGKLAAMAGELQHHVEEEEQDLLPVLSSKASDAERDDLGARFAAATGADRSVQTQGSPRTQGSPEDRDGRTRDELYQEAKEKDVSGRSRMSRDELAEALDEQDG